MKVATEGAVKDLEPTREGAPAAQRATPAKGAKPAKGAAAGGGAAAKPKTRGPKAKRTAPTALSEAGVRFIARFEGFSARLYDDAAGHCTIGFGHLVHHGPTNGSEPAEFRAGITRERAYALLREDAAAAAAEVRRSVRVPLAQHQFDALVCFAFNVGNGAFRESTLVRLLNEGDYAAVPAQLARWTKAGGRTLPGLVRRRAEEGALFAAGTY